MKIFVCAIFVLAVVAAEPPRYRQARFKAEKQEVESDKEATTPKTDDAPYPAAGFRPPTEFIIPARQEVFPPATSYGIPADSYGAPLNVYTLSHTEYGVPDVSKGKEQKEGDGKDKGTAKPGNEKKDEEDKKGDDKKENEAEALKDSPKKAKLEEGRDTQTEVIATGAYYVLLPDSQLQRIQFRTENDYSNMAYTAKLQYRNEERAPIFVYTAVPQYQSAAYVQVSGW